MKTYIRFIRRVLGVAFINLFVATPSLAVEIALNPTLTFQTILGWEATADIYQQPGTPDPAYREEMLDRVVNEIGINRVRLEIRAGAENPTDVISRFIKGELSFDAWKAQRYRAINDNNDPNLINWDGFDFAELDWHIDKTVLPLRARLNARGEKLSVNVTYVAFRDGWFFQQNPDEYGELVLATYLHMQDKYGFVPDTWEAILEPDMSKNAWSGRVIGRAVVAASKRLKENGFTPAFVVPSVTNLDNASRMLDSIATVPGAMDNVVEFSYHRYRGNPETTLPGIAARGRFWGIRTSMLELWFGRGTPQVLHQDLESANVSVWQGRVVMGMYDVEYKASDNPVFQLREDMRYNVQYFRYIHRGAVRIEALSSVPQALDPVAFINRGGDYVVILLADRANPITISGLPAGQYQVSYTVDSGSVVQDRAIQVDESGQLTTAIPGAGVLTVSGL